MPKIVIDEIASGYSLSKINDQFNKIETYINDKVMSRDSDGNANAMSEDLDMNSNQILNLPTPTAPTDPVRLQDIPNLVTAAEGANYVGETAPLTAFQGMRWYNPSLPATFVYYVDGDSGQWVEEAHEGVDGALRSDLQNVNSTVPIAGVPAKALATRYGLTVNVKDYGAVGDGIVDDTAAIQAAVNSVINAPSNIEVYIPKGLFKISAPILLDGGTRVPSIYGAGSAETTLITSGSLGVGVPLISIRRNSGNRVVGRTFQGFTVRDISGTSHGLHLEWVSECTFRDIGLYSLATGFNFFDVVYSCHFSQIKSSVMAGPSVVMRDESNQLLFSNCILSGGTEGVRMLGSFSAVKFLNCDFENGSSYHLEVTPIAGKKGRGLSVDNCYFENGATFSVYINPADSQGVEGFDINSNYFIVQPGTVAAPLVVRNCVGGDIVGNSANRYTSYFYNRDGSARKLNVSHNVYDAPALTSVGNYDGAPSGNLLVNNTTGSSFSNGSGTPEGFLVAAPGSLYLNVDGGASTTLYVKATGTGNTGWVAK